MTEPRYKHLEGLLADLACEQYDLLRHEWGTVRALNTRPGYDLLMQNHLEQTQQFEISTEQVLLFVANMADADLQQEAREERDALLARIECLESRLEDLESRP